MILISIQWLRLFLKAFHSLYAPLLQSSFSVDEGSATHFFSVSLCNCISPMLGIIFVWHHLPVRGVARAKRWQVLSERSFQAYLKDLRAARIDFPFASAEGKRE
jgi:hypothetical protein